MQVIRNFINKIKISPLWNLVILFTSLIGALIIFSPLVFRIMRDTLPKNLPTDLWFSSSYLRLFFFLFAFFSWFYILIYQCRLLGYKYFNIGTQPKTFPFMRKTKYFLDKCIINFYISIEQFWWVPNFYVNFACPFIIRLMFYLCTRYRMWLFTFFMQVFPKSIIMIALVVDIVIYHQFNFIYTFSFVLIFILLERFIVFWSTFFTETSMESLDIQSCLYVHESETYTSTSAYFWRFHDTEYEKALNNKHHIIKSTFPLAVEDLFEMVLEPEWDNQQRAIYPFYDPMRVLMIMYEQAYYRVFPIATFSNTYKSFRLEILEKFLLLQSFIYTLIWGYAVFYVF